VELSKEGSTLKDKLCFTLYNSAAFPFDLLAQHVRSAIQISWESNVRRLGPSCLSRHRKMKLKQKVAAFAATGRLL
jgi:hypothetical protein